ncbi:MAG: hypothetical protein GEV12_12030 [Micromonosporaceae bacterium]|nr:hypothetical protein [Micromonosporaceae bacterium]
MSPLPTAPPRLSTQDARLRTAYLRDLLGTLYPAGAGDTEYLVLPTARRPRLLVPAGPRTGRAAAAAVRHATEPRSGRARAVRQLAAVALRTGAARLPLLDRVRVQTAGSLESYLRELFGSPIALAIHVGPARANRKPVLQLLDPTGALVGFAKLGTTSLTSRLVRAETAALTALSPLRLRQVTVPRVWHAGQWGEHRLLVQSALPVWRPRAALAPERLALAMREVAECRGTGTGPLATSSYWQRLQERVTAVTDQPEGRTLAAATATLLSRSGRVELPYGAWHGDWSPWNMATLPGTVLLWDWERFTMDVPVGFDAVHYHLQRQLAAGPDAAAAVRATLDAAGRLLAPFAVPPAAREITALLYLVDLAARYLTDRQAAAGARLGVLGTWLLPVLVARLQELS